MPFSIKKPEFICKTWSCRLFRKSITLSDDNTPVLCERCGREYTTQKNKNGFMVYEHKNPKHNCWYNKLYRLVKTPLSIFVSSVILGTYCLIAVYLITNLFFSWIKNYSIEIHVWAISILLLFCSLFFSALFFKYLYKKFFDVLKERVKLEDKWNNNYFIFALYAIIIFLFFGLLLFKSFYGSPFPLVMESTSLSSNLTVRGECRDSADNLDPISGREFSCNLEIHNPTSENYNISRVRFYYREKSAEEGNDTDRNILNEYKALPENSSRTIPYLYVPIEPSGTYTLMAYVYLTNDGDEERIKTKYVEYISITQKEYNEKQNTRFTILLLIFSASVFSIFSMTNNIKSIIEGKNNKP